MLGLTVHEHAGQDLRAIAAVDPDGAAYILAWLQEAEADPQLLDDLVQVREHFISKDDEDWISSKPWWNERKRYLWRLRFFELEDRKRSYRLIFGLVSKRQRIYVLGITVRGTMDYDNASDFRTRICEAYDELI